MGSEKRKRGGKSRRSEEARRVIPRDVLLAGRVCSMQGDESEPVYCLKALSYASSSFATTSQPLGLTKPPGLELSANPEVDGSESAPRESTKAQPEQSLMPDQAEPEQFKVLLQNLPDSMLNESMLRVMLEQAQLSDITEVAYRNGKALLTFTSYASVRKCLSHCNGRLWSNSTAPVVAMYVKTVSRKKPQTDVETKPLSADAPTFVPEPDTTFVPEAETKPLSADAPAFVPGSLQIPTKALSAEAPIFVPSDCKVIRDRDRIDSNASTESGVSDKVASDSEPEILFGTSLEPEVPLVCT